MKQDHFTDTKQRDVREAYTLSTVHSQMTKVQSSQGDNNKMTPNAVADNKKYKIGTDKSNLFLSYYTF